ncbi:MAG: hypothetical protein O7G85_14480 [Planctomycetota bacterium]|nr:hypothetical protein [Planctomycetota bacterium]
MGRSRVICAAMMILFNISCSLVATAHPQAAPDKSAALPDVSEVVGAWITARQWIEAFEVPRLDDEAARVPIPDAHGISVILRHRGRIVGQGHDESGDNLMLRRAVGRALSNALGDQVIARLPDEQRTLVGTSLNLELEVAGQFLPVPGRTFEQISRRIVPGVEGIALRHQQRWAVTYASQMLAMNTATNLSGLLGGLSAELGFMITDLRRTQLQDDFTVYRFRSVHLAQTSNHAFPHQVHRSGKLIMPYQVNTQSLRTTAQQLVEHLKTHQWPLEPPQAGDPDYSPPPGLRGDYNPIVDRYHPIVAPPLDQALTAYALLRYAKSRLADDPQSAQDAIAFAQRILLDLTRLNDSMQNTRAEPIASAAIVYALLELDNREDHDEFESLLSDSATRLTKFLQPDGTLKQPQPEGDPLDITPHGQALIAGALARLHVLKRPEVPARESVRAAIDAAWNSLPDHQQIGLLPWIGWAEADYAKSMVGPAPEPTRLERLLRSLEASLIRHEIRIEPDLVGGLSLTQAQAGSRPQATAQTFRPAAWMARFVAGQDNMEPVRIKALTDGHWLTIRFLQQLTVREDSKWRFQSPKRSFGGIQASPWDSKQPLAAQSMGLLTAAETLLALQEAHNH